MVNLEDDDGDGVAGDAGDGDGVAGDAGKAPAKAMKKKKAAMKAKPASKQKDRLAQARAKAKAKADATKAAKQVRKVANAAKKLRAKEATLKRKKMPMKAAKASARHKKARATLDETVAAMKAGCWVGEDRANTVVAETETKAKSKELLPEEYSLECGDHKLGDAFRGCVGTVMDALEDMWGKVAPNELGVKERLQRFQADGPTLMSDCFAGAGTATIAFGSFRNTAKSRYDCPLELEGCMASDSAKPQQEVLSANPDVIQVGEDLRDIFPPQLRRDLESVIPETVQVRRDDLLRAMGLTKVAAHKALPRPKKVAAKKQPRGKAIC